MTQPDDLNAPETLLTPSEVAALFRVNPKTVTRWAAPASSTPSAPSVGTGASGRRRSVVASRRCPTSRVMVDEA